MVSVVFVATAIFTLLPFTGLNQSGNGVGGIPYMMHDMAIEKMMVSSRHGSRSSVERHDRGVEIN